MAPQSPTPSSSTPLSSPTFQVTPRPPVAERLPYDQCPPLLLPSRQPLPIPYRRARVRLLQLQGAEQEHEPDEIVASGIDVEVTILSGHTSAKTQDRPRTSSMSSLTLRIETAGGVVPPSYSVPTNLSGHVRA